MNKSGIFYNLMTASRLVRIKTSVIAFVITAVISIYHYQDAANAFVLGLTVMSTACFGYAINEYFDHIKDILMPHDHLIPAGLISRKQVLVISFSFLFLSLALTIFLSPFQQILNLSLLFILSIYSYVNNKNGVMANILVATCSCLGILITLNHFEWSLTAYSAVTFFLHILAREIILDIHDYKADQKIGKSSIPLLFSIKRSFLIAALLSLACMMYAVAIGVYFMSVSYICFVCIANLVFLVCLLRYKAKTEERQYKDFVRYSRISFLLAIPAFLL